MPVFGDRTPLTATQPVARSSGTSGPCLEFMATTGGAAHPILQKVPPLLSSFLELFNGQAMGHNW